MSAFIDELNAAAYRYQLSLQDTFNEMCAPLLNLGIKYFYYSTFFKTGEYLQFCNNEDFIREHYLNIKHPGTICVNAYQDLFLTNKNKSYYLIQYDKKNQDLVIDLLVCKNFWNGFLILKKEADYIKTYCFGTDTDNDLFSQFYFQNLPLLEHFCNYFEEKAKYALPCMDKSKFGVLDVAKDFSPNYQEKFLLPNTQLFLQETFISKRILKNKEKDIHLSNREVECLHHLSLGKTIKEIARVLDLSPRSVEFYLDNVKKRSGLNRGELIASFTRNFSSLYYEKSNL